MASEETQPRPAGPLDHAIVVRGARVHNLRNIDVEIPRDKLVVLTGVSGSGKSSLAFDTLFAEGQRRYIESLSAYARHFLDQLERPDVDLIEGLPPTVSIDQRSGSGNPRSTVATVTEIYDYLRLLYARAGLSHCPQCGLAIHRQTPEQMVAGVLGMQEGRKVLVLAPLVRGRKGQHAEAFQAIRRAGLLRARVDGEVVEIRDDPKLAKTKTHDVEAVIDRLVVREGIRPRLAESIGLALKLGEGTIILSFQTETGWEDRVLSIHYACTQCNVGFQELEPRTFSFNSPYGACPTCDGLGTLSAFDAELVIPSRDRSLAQGAVAPWEAARPKIREALVNDPALTAFLKRHGLTKRSKLASWPAKAFKMFLQGEPASEFPGVLALLEQAYQTAKTESQLATLAEFRGEAICPTCQGARLRPQALAVTLGDKSIHQATSLPVAEAIGFFAGLSFEPPLDLVGPPLVREITSRLAFLNDVGLAYLTLARPADTLSGGELQRVRLASQIGSGLVGVGYLLDEPTAGLHPRDTSRLLQSLTHLRDQGNSVMVVEHDEATIRAADWLIDLGPGAGPDGGLVVAMGLPEALIESQSGASLTARYLRREATISVPTSERLTRDHGWIVVRGASEHNLKRIDARFPTGCLTCVTGVSGSGKSTLVLDVLARAVRRALENLGPRPGRHDRVEGLDLIDKQITIDQAPIGRTPRSTPSTYTGVFDEIRKVFAMTREAKVRGYKASRFSFNVKGGRCETCQGQGTRRIEMNFLPDLFVRCEACGGKRFNRQTLDIKYKGLSIGDALDLRVDEARDIFEPVPKVKAGLDALHEVGLGYMTLGQSSTTLSGGEAQRVKLAAELGRVSTGRTLYILDEPTTGLHFADVENLMRVLHRLADLGNSLVVIEHNLDVIRTADWVIDLGPECGEEGGRVVALGSPREVSNVKESVTGQYLRPQFAGSG
ncbi:MAG TPA: excinuclease ABC subunit UvrA [Isosphaeraceae bacterium]|jgi:excinuclease ABC subunit A|nr:excinuclease ABC subunit UvrA [Isosphaeraceae bacterium]